MRAALLAHDEVLRSSIEAHGGYLFSHTGDGVVAAFASPTGSNEPLYGRTDTKSPMVYSSMVHVAGGEEGSIRQGRLSANARAHSARLGATCSGARIQRHRYIERAVSARVRSQSRRRPATAGGDGSN